MNREQIEELWREANNKADDFQPNAATQKLIDQFVAEYQAAGLKKPAASGERPTPETQGLPTVVYVVSTGKMRVAIESVAQMQLDDVAKSAIERFISMGCPPLGTLMEITECSDHADRADTPPLVKLMPYAHLCRRLERDLAEAREQLRAESNLAYERTRLYHDEWNKNAELIDELAAERASRFTIAEVAECSPTMEMRFRDE